MDLAGVNILITGASGRIGRQLLREFLARGIKPIAHVRAASDTTLIDRLGLEKRPADLRDSTQLERLAQGIHAIVHTAALVDFRGDRLTQFTGINTMAALDLYRAARKVGVRRFVHVSTVAAIGAPPRTARDANGIVQPVDETFEFNLKHLRVPYILTKRAAEEELLTAAAEGGPELIIVNPSIVIDEKSSAYGLGNIERRLRGLLPDVPSVINLVDIRDVSAGIIAALEKGRSGERYILGGDNLTLREAVDIAGPHLRRRPRLVRMPRPLLHAAARLSKAWVALRGGSRLMLYPDLVKMLDYDWAYSSEKAKRELGYRPRPYAETVRDLPVR